MIPFPDFLPGAARRVLAQHRAGLGSEPGERAESLPLLFLALAIPLILSGAITCAIEALCKALPA